MSRIRGRPPAKVHILRDGHDTYSSIPDIVEHLADGFQKITSDRNYKHTFFKFKQNIEKIHLDFSTNEEMIYNQPFQLHELAEAIKSNKNTSPGMDQIHNLMIQHLPENAKKHLLYIYTILYGTAITSHQNSAKPP